ncbi:hypothetical protein RRG08_062717 [Elysia crispata]|uniref:Uncharacterized protein n=1 Tax=Elysia crispata TaxID=231223 RepID=A0AAE1ACB8_9GAST|nr:hypothetical protein RRG08_062717 [Elysia crispata]
MTDRLGVALDHTLTSITKRHWRRPDNHRLQAPSLTLASGYRPCLQDVRPPPPILTPSAACCIVRVFVGQSDTDPEVTPEGLVLKHLE